MPQDADQEPVDLAREAEFSLGAIRVKPATREVTVGAHAEIFEPRVLQVLVVLAQRRGEVVSREELGTRCWEGRTVGEDALNRCIGRIRRLAETSDAFTIETIPRVGYRLAVVERAASADTDALQSPPPPSVPTPRAGESAGFIRRHARALVAGALVVMVAVAVGAWFASGPRVGKAKLDERTVLVLPFNALNDEADLRNFAQSISVSISNLLAQSGARVFSPAKAEMFRGAERSRAAEESGVRFIIDGEVRREGE